MIQVIHDIITDHILASFIEYIHRIQSLKKLECKNQNQFSQKYDDQRLLKCKLDLLCDILKQVNIILQTHNEKNCEKLKWDRQMEKKSLVPFSEVGWGICYLI